jgi:cellulose synthase/poly-beta-1,6-N-acetylglucosamine synthase-like glycosyltransferase
VPSRRQPAPDSASSLDVTVEELAVGVGTQGSVAFGRSEPQKGAAQGLMLTNPAYITENCSNCSIFVDGNSRCGVWKRETQTIHGWGNDTMCLVTDTPASLPWSRVATLSQRARWFQYSCYSLRTFLFRSECASDGGAIPKYYSVCLLLYLNFMPTLQAVLVY